MNYGIIQDMIMKLLLGIAIAGEVVGVAMIVRGGVWGGRESAVICGVGCALLAASAITHTVGIFSHYNERKK